jgi:subtilisin family serine protease
MYFVDTGVAYQPPEIGTAAIQFNCFDPSNSIGVQESVYDSGTHGSGTTTVTAATDNGIALAGAANFEGNRIQLIMCRITNGGIDTATVEGVLTALNFIYLTSWFAPGPINVSVGSAPPNTLNSLASIQTAAQKLQQKGFLVVMAAGNNGAYDSSPESYVRRVLALSANGIRASWSNYGPFYAAAPGDQVSIYVPGGIAEYFGSGTSFAAPRWCAAIAAVMAALPPSKRIATFADAIVTYTASTTPEGYKVPNFQAAIQMAAAQ